MTTLVQSFLDLAGNKLYHKSLDEFLDFGKIPSQTLELAALERLKNKIIVL